jgi:signal transduction histidine kinase
MLSLEVRSGPLSGRRFALDDGLLIGRGAECGISLPDVKMSRRHARILVKRAKVLIEDLGSNNGTELNGKRVRRARLRAGDRVRLGRTDLEVVQPGAERVVAQAAAPSRDVEAETVPAARHTPTPVRVEAMPTQPFLEALLARASALPDGGQALQGLVSNRHFAVVYRLAWAMEEATELSELLDTVVDLVFDVIDAERCFILLEDLETGELRPQLARHRDGGSVAPIDLSAGVLERVINEKIAVVSSNVQDDPRFAERDSILEIGVRSVLCVPVLDDAEVRGLIQLDRLSGRTAFGRRDFELITVIASLLGLRLRNLRLFEQEAEALRALQRAQAELVRSERLAALGQLTSGLAHELRNLMAPFIVADELATEHPEDSGLVEVGHLLMEARDRMLVVLDEVRGMAKGVKPELSTGRHDLRATVDRVARFAGYDRDVRRHRLRVVGGSVTCLYDEGSIKQVLFNLIRNAAQAMHEAGEITIRVARDSEAGPRGARIDVVDEGAGIPPELMKRIWEPFFTTRGDRGTGLGLHICRSMVERHRGQIRCRSEPGGGTTVTVLLPGELTSESPRSERS